MQYKKKLHLIIAFTAIFITSQAQAVINPSDFSVSFRDMDGISTGSQWRYLAFKINNNSGTDVDMSKMKLVYLMSDSSDSMVSEIWYYNVRSEDWTIQGGNISELTADIKYHESQNTATGNRELVLKFESHIIPAGGIAEIQMGIRNSDWSTIDETEDPSYISASTYTINSMISIQKVIPDSVINILDQKAAEKGVNTDTGSISEACSHEFTELEEIFFSKKYLDSFGNIVKITINDSGDTFNLDSLPFQNRKEQVNKYGTAVPQLAQKLDSVSSEKVIPVSINANLKGVSFYRPPVLRTDTVIDYNAWKAENDSILLARNAQIQAKNIELVNRINSLISADTSLSGFDPQITTDNNIGVVTCRLPAKLIDSLSYDTSNILITDCENVLPEPDLWTSGFRMNVDDLHCHGFYGDSINVANWEEGYPNFESQLYLPSSNVRFSKNEVEDSLAWLYSYYPTPTADSMIDSKINNQHIAYMLASIRNNRTNTIDSSAPTEYCGTGFAPEAELFLANYTLKYIGEFLVNDMLVKPLQWCIDHNISVINQSWHTLKSYDTITRGGVAYGFNSQYSGSNTFDDQYIDFIASTYPYPTFCQAAGNLEYDATINGYVDEFVNHKGYNTVVVGWDLRDGGMSPASAFKNPLSTQELPHVTCGVSYEPGTSMFEYSSDSSIVTKSGATSLASSMCAGFVSSVQSINPTLLKHSPWAVRAILMAGADNIIGPTWVDDATVDQRDGAGRLNGTNSMLIASNPYSSGTGVEHGFYVGEIDSGSLYTKEIPIVVTNPSFHGAVNNGYLRVALSWIGHVDPVTFVSTISDLDLELIDPDGDVIERSASLVNPVEHIYITGAVAGEQYTIRIKTAGNVKYDTPFAVAWVNR